MVNNEYAKTYKEVFEVLKLTPKAELKLIPIEVLNELKIESQKYKEKYKLEFDKMGDPKISREAQVMILGIYSKYLLKENERKYLNKKLQKTDYEQEIRKVKNYNNTNDIFYKTTNNKNENCNVTENELKSNIDKEDFDIKDEILIVSENKIKIFFKNIFGKIKKWLKIN